MTEQLEPDVRDIERAYDEPPDEPHPRYEDEEEVDTDDVT